MFPSNPTLCFSLPRSPFLNFNNSTNQQMNQRQCISSYTAPVLYTFM
jgi:hypothetical protein